MRTTLVIPDPIFERSKQEARRRHCTLSEFFTEAAEEELVRSRQEVREGRAPYKVSPVAMGKPTVDVSNREELYRGMEE